MGLLMATAQGRRAPLRSRRRCVLGSNVCRTLATLERLEDRTLLNVDLVNSFSNLGRSYTPTEVVASIRGADPLAILARAANEPWAGIINFQSTWELIPEDDSSVLRIGIKDGANPLEVIGRLQSLPFVEWAAPNYVYRPEVLGDPRELIPNDPRYSEQYHHPLMRNNLAWDTTLGSPSIIIAVTDDGVSLAHQDLAPNIWRNPGEVAGNGIDDDGNGFIDDINGWDFSSNDNNPNPVGTNSHGTHVSGIAAGRTNNGIGIAGTAGGSTIMPIRFFGSGAWTSTVIAASYRYAVDNGARIINTSYNVDQFANDLTFLAGLNYLYDRGGLHLNSAGNNNQLNPPRQVLDQSLFVANTDSADRKSSSSNYGFGIDIAAPGSNILSTLPNNMYGLNSGTSMAAPNAAGVAALIWSAHPEWTRDQVAAQLVGTADNIDALNLAFAGLLGSGRVNSFRGVTETLAAPRIEGVPGLPPEGGTTSPFASFQMDTANVLDPSSVTLSNFELRGDGPDNTFDTADDVVIPLTLPANFTYRIGTNRLNFGVTGFLGRDRYRFRAISGGLRDPFGTPLDGNGDGVGGDSFDRIFNISIGISGTKWNDRNGNGTLDTGEPTLQGWTIFLDQDNNGLLDPGELSTVTGASGNYSFPDLPDGTYVVREVTQPGWRQTFPASGFHSVIITGSQSATGRNFGNDPNSIAGTKWNDRNGDGVRDPGEPILQGWTIYLDQNDNGQFDPGERTSVTDATGNYSFIGLPPGTHVVREVVQANWTQTFPTPGFHSVTIAAGQDVTGINFGNRQVATPLATVDDGEWGFQVSGSGWTVNTSAGFQGDHRIRLAGASNTSPARWSIQQAPGTYQFFVTWVARPTNVTTAQYQLFDGPTLRSTISVNQRVAPTDILVGGTLWRSLGTFTTTNPLLRIVLTSTSTTFELVADAAFIAGTAPASGASPESEEGGGTAIDVAGGAPETEAEVSASADLFDWLPPRDDLDPQDEGLVSAFDTPPMGPSTPPQATDEAVARIAIVSTASPAAIVGEEAQVESPWFATRQDLVLAGGEADSSLPSIDAPAESDAAPTDVGSDHAIVVAPDEHEPAATPEVARGSGPDEAILDTPAAVAWPSLDPLIVDRLLDCDEADDPGSVLIRWERGASAPEEDN